MELKKAIEILNYHQEWRLGKRDKMIYEPKEITQALDALLNEVQKKCECGSKNGFITICAKCCKAYTGAS